MYGANDGPGAGVEGIGNSGVWGKSSKTGYGAVYGQHTGTDGYGIVGDGKGGSAGVLGVNTDGNAVTGQATGEGNGVYGQVSGIGVGVLGRNTSGGGAGVEGEGGFAGVRGESTKGYGGHFQGVKAQLMLKPKGGTAGKPTTGTHAQGEISMDSAATL